MKRMGFWNEKEPTVEHINYIKEVYEAGSLFDKLDEDINILKGLKSYRSEKGRDPVLRNLIAAVWAQVMKDRRGFNWENIEHLFGWFDARLKNSLYLNTLGSPNFYQFSLKNAYQRYKGKEKYEDLFLSIKKRYFPTPRKAPHLRIEFKKEHILIDFIKKDYPLIIFPDGKTFNK